MNLKETNKKINPEKEMKIVVDNAKEKRVELCAHTNMSETGIVKPRELVERAITLGHKAIAVTDLESVQSFPELENIIKSCDKKIKMIYGATVKVYDDEGDTLHHATILVKNQLGLKNLYKIISSSHTECYNKFRCISKHKLNELREGLLLGLLCYEEAMHVHDITNLKLNFEKYIEFYDFIVLTPFNGYESLADLEYDFKQKMKDLYSKIIKTCDKLSKLVIASGCVYHLDKEDAICYNILLSKKHNKQSINTSSCHFRTTNEMLEEFKVLGKEIAKKIVITNTNKIADMISNIQILKDQMCLPKVKDSANNIKKIVSQKATELYGDYKNVKVINDRITKELDSIINNGFESIFLIAEQAVRKSEELGYPVSSRGSVGSSLIAYLLGITNINPLPAHYLCSECKKIELSIGDDVDCGFDLPNKRCFCGAEFNKDGHNIPVETFLGYNLDIMPDIDLNFSVDIQGKIQGHLKDILGNDKVLRVGTIYTTSKGTALEMIKKFAEDQNLELKQNDIETIANKLVGTKRTSGQQPGGLWIIPEDKEVYDFTPYQYQDDDITSSWKTAHLSTKDLGNIIFKFNILGHDDLTIIKELKELTGVKDSDINFTDKKVLNLFVRPDNLGITSNQIMFETGTLGIQEFSTEFVKNMLTLTQPKTFSHLVKLSGLSHSTGGWINNTKDLITNKTCELMDTIANRDDIMNYLVKSNLETEDAYNIMEFVCKGKIGRNYSEWNEVWMPKMTKANIPDCFIESCSKIKYLFPKAHGTAYVINAYVVAWFKLYYPLEFYKTYFDIRCYNFEIDTMILGYDGIKNRLDELNTKSSELSMEENCIKDSLSIALEMCARGYKFALDKNQPKDGKPLIEINKENKTLILI